MNTDWQRKRTSAPRRLQVLIRLAVAGVSAGILIPPARARAQLLPFTVTIIDWQAAALERQRSAYRKEAKRRELLFCVEAWKVDSAVAGYQRIAIERTRRETAG